MQTSQWLHISDQTEKVRFINELPDEFMERFSEYSECYCIIVVYGTSKENEQTKFLQTINITNPNNDIIDRTLLFLLANDFMDRFFHFEVKKINSIYVLDIVERELKISELMSYYKMKKEEIYEIGHLIGEDKKNHE